MSICRGRDKELEKVAQTLQGEGAKGGGGRGRGEEEERERVYNIRVGK